MGASSGWESTPTSGVWAALKGFDPSITKGGWDGDEEPAREIWVLACTGELQGLLSTSQG